MQSYRKRHCGICIPIAIMLLLSSCGAEKKRVEAFPKEPKPIAEEKSLSPGSLFTGYDNLFSDTKAHRVGDVITIAVYETLSGSGSAETNSAKKSSYNLELNKPTVFGKPFPGKSKDPLLGFSTNPSESFSGKSTTSRNAKLIATISARVEKVYPNGDLYIVGEKIIKINDDVQILRISGIVRPDDIGPDNTVPSSKIADMYVEYNGKGYFNNSQRPGWLARFLEKIWPF